MTSPFRSEEYTSEEYPYEKNCPICGRQFFPTEEWGYKRGPKAYPILVCSFPCAREYDRREDEKKEREYKTLLPFFNCIYIELMVPRGVVTTEQITTVGAKLCGIKKKKRIAELWVRFAQEKGLSKSRHGYRIR